MKILMLAPLPPPSGGIASWTIKFQAYCKENRIPLIIVNTAIRGGRTTNLHTKRNIIDELSRSISILKNAKKGIRLEKPDLIHFNTSCSPFGIIRDAIIAFLLKRKTPIVLHCRCNIEDQLGNSSLPRKAFRYLVKMSDRIIVLNKYSRAFVDSIAVGKTVFIPNFANEKSICESHTINNRITKAVYVGHIERAKGIIQIVEAARLLPDIEFVLVGEKTEDLSIQIPSNITFTGNVPSQEVQTYLRQADVFIFPSLTEGFSNALLEAMAMGLPVIASDVGANSEMIGDHGGIILDDNTGEKIYNAFLALQKPEIRKAMSEWSIQKVKSAYMIQNVMAEYFDLYSEIIERKKKE